MELGGPGRRKSVSRDRPGPCVPHSELPVVLRVTDLWPQCLLWSKGCPEFQTSRNGSEKTPVCYALPWRFAVMAALWILRNLLGIESLGPFPLVLWLSLCKSASPIFQHRIPKHPYLSAAKVRDDKLGPNLLLKMMETLPETEGGKRNRAVGMQQICWPPPLPTQSPKGALGLESRTGLRIELKLGSLLFWMPSVLVACIQHNKHSIGKGKFY